MILPKNYETLLWTAPVQSSIFLLSSLFDPLAAGTNYPLLSFEKGLITDETGHTDVYAKIDSGGSGMWMLMLINDSVLVSITPKNIMPYWPPGIYHVEAQSGLITALSEPLLLGSPFPEYEHKVGHERILIWYQIKWSFKELIEPMWFLSGWLQNSTLYLTKSSPNRNILSRLRAMVQMASLALILL